MYTTILGAGLAGISSSFHLGHENCIAFEKNAYVGGHIHSYGLDGFTWDEGPHVSFTKNEYVKDLFAKGVDQRYLSYEVKTANYFKGYWIPHPAQSNLYAVPLPLRKKCLDDFLSSRMQSEGVAPSNYEEWLLLAFGRAFYENFPRAYTEKYWTIAPAKLTTDWVGERVFYPNVNDVEKGYLGVPEKETHYITHVRYPERGGYYSFAKEMVKNMKVQLNTEIAYISFKDKKLTTVNGTTFFYKQLINTLPLPILVERSDAPSEIKAAARMLSCSAVLLINVTASHPTMKDYNWMYIYDEDKYSTRINCSEKLSPYNTPEQNTGIQVEVYFSKYREKTIADNTIAQKVCEELIEMGLIRDRSSITSCHTKWVQWANVIFDHQRKEALDIIYRWLEQFGLERNEQDLLPMTDWNNLNMNKCGDIIMVGRFAEWKYYWTDDCILSGKNLNRNYIL